MMEERNGDNDFWSSWFSDRRRETIRETNRHREGKQKSVKPGMQEKREKGQLFQIDNQ
jgi:hypothetical protein